MSKAEADTMADIPHPLFTPGIPTWLWSWGVFSKKKKKSPNVIQISPPLSVIEQEGLGGRIRISGAVLNYQSISSQLTPT